MDGSIKQFSDFHMLSRQYKSGTTISRKGNQNIPDTRPNHGSVKVNVGTASVWGPVNISSLPLAQVQWIPNCLKPIVYPIYSRSIFSQAMLFAHFTDLDINFNMFTQLHRARMMTSHCRKLNTSIKSSQHLKETRSHLKSRF